MLYKNNKNFKYEKQKHGNLFCFLITNKLYQPAVLHSCRFAANTFPVAYKV